MATDQLEEPAERTQRRASQLVPGIEAAKAAIMLESQRRAQIDYHDRVKDGHQLGQALLKAAGVKLGGGETEAGDMGGIFICGDIHNETKGTDAGSAVQPTQATTQAESGLMKKALPLVLSAVLGGGTVGGLALLTQWLNRPSTGTEAGARVRVFWGEKELQPGDKLGASVEETK